jgi:hypothetical protein
MGLFDKLFGLGTPSQGILMEPPEESSDDEVLIPPELAKELLEKKETVVVKVKEEGKAIKPECWDELTDEAKEALTSKGFYREGDEKDVIL